MDCPPLTPRLDRYIVDPDVPPKATAGGILLPDPTQGKPENKPLFGRVLAAGPGGSNKFGHHVIPDKGLIGKRVAYAQWAGGEVKWNDHIYLAIRDEDILCVFDAEAALTGEQLAALERKKQAEQEADRESEPGDIWYHCLACGLSRPVASADDLPRGNETCSHEWALMKP